MEKNQKQVLHGDRPARLDFNLPLLSTRRPSAYAPDTKLQSNLETTPVNTCNGVPFSWERTPGKPKDLGTNNTSNFYAPPPKPPPGWSHTIRGIADDSIFDQNCDFDDGCDGDIDDDYSQDHGHDHRFSDAIDIFSLAESVEDMEAEEDVFQTEEPNFIIQRFLPDAQALAAQSVSSVNNNASVSRAVSVRRSYPSPKGCGLGVLFPWRMRPKPCSMKSPVRAVMNPQWGTKQKQKHSLNKGM